MFRHSGDGQTAAGVPDTASEASPTRGRTKAGVIRRGTQR